MLNDSEITLVESIYLVLEGDILTDEMQLLLNDYVYRHNFEQHVYLQWLINRWSFLKRDKHHFPLRRLNLNKYVELHPIVKLQNTKKIWECKSCYLKQSARHNFCSSCGVTQHY